jgi:hypothetical protein
MIASFGDTLDLMGGKFDPRHTKGSIRPEHNRPDYFDSVVNDAAKWLEPYAKNIVVLGSGNHETAMTKRHEFNPTERLACLLNTRADGRVFNGGYSGWIVFAFAQKYKNRTRSTTLTLNYHHGSSSGKSSANIASHEKRAAFLPDADVIVTGHAHNCWQDVVARQRLGANGTVYRDEQIHVGLSGYKDDTGDGSEGWANENGFRPRPLGAYWLRFYWCRRTYEVKCQAMRAQ